MGYVPGRRWEYFGRLLQSPYRSLQQLVIPHATFFCWGAGGCICCNGCERGYSAPNTCLGQLSGLKHPWDDEKEWTALCGWWTHGSTFPSAADDTFFLHSSKILDSLWQKKRMIPDYTKVPSVSKSLKECWHDGHFLCYVITASFR